MPPNSSNRRQFLHSTATAAAGVALAATHASATQAADASRSIRLGAPVFNAPDDPEELARLHREQGYRAAYCPSVELSDKARIREISTAFAKHDVVIAEVGRWCNLLDADPQRRAANLQKVTDGLALADEIGALCCVDIAGSYSTDEWYGPHEKNLSDEFFEASVENARKIIDAVKPKRAKFGYEMMGWALPDSADAYVRMYKAVDRPAFGVHLDPCNAINSPGRIYGNRQLIDECFDKLGPWIVSCHAKDVAWQVEMQVHFREVVLGEGVLDYKTYLKRLAALPHSPPLMIEHLKSEAEYHRSRDFLFETGQQIGVRFDA